MKFPSPRQLYYKSQMILKFFIRSVMVVPFPLWFILSVSVACVNCIFFLFFSFIYFLYKFALLSGFVSIWRWYAEARVVLGEVNIVTVGMIRPRAFCFSFVWYFGLNRIMVLPSAVCKICQILLLVIFLLVFFNLFNLLFLGTCLVFFPLLLCPLLLFLLLLVLKLAFYLCYLFAALTGSFCST